MFICLRSSLTDGYAEEESGPLSWQFYLRISNTRKALSCWLHLMNSCRWYSIECVTSSVHWPDYLSCQMESLDITIKLPLTLEYNQLYIKLSSCDTEAAAIIYLRSIRHIAGAFERCESLYSSNYFLCNLPEGIPISNFHKTALKGHALMQINEAWQQLEGFYSLYFY